MIKNRDAAWGVLGLCEICGKETSRVPRAPHPMWLCAWCDSPSDGRPLPGEDDSVSQEKFRASLGDPETLDAARLEYSVGGYPSVRKFREQLVGVQAGLVTTFGMPGGSNG